jgi:di/tricarboxylate transporter
VTPHDRWKNRRRMAWAALVAGLLFPALLLWSQSDQLGAVAGPFYIFVGAVVGAYIGFATVDDKWRHDSGRSEDEPAPWPEGPRR